MNDEQIRAMFGIVMKVSGTRVTPTEALQMYEVYNLVGTFARVARIFNCSESTAARHIKIELARRDEGVF